MQRGHDAPEPCRDRVASHQNLHQPHRNPQYQNHWDGHLLGCHPQAPEEKATKRFIWEGLEQMGATSL